MTARPVSTLVNKPANHDERCVETFGMLKSSICLTVGHRKRAIPSLSLNAFRNDTCWRLY